MWCLRNAGTYKHTHSHTHTHTSTHIHTHTHIYYSGIYVLAHHDVWHIWTGRLCKISHKVCIFIQRNSTRDFLYEIYTFSVDFFCCFSFVGDVLRCKVYIYIRIYIVTLYIEREIHNIYIYKNMCKSCKYAFFMFFFGFLDVLRCLMCALVCVYVLKSILVRTHTHTHTYIYI